MPSLEMLCRDESWLIIMEREQEPLSRTIARWKVASRRTLIIALLVAAGLASGLGAGADDGSGAGPADVEKIKFLETRVKPIIEAHCLKCHGDGPDVKGGLRPTSRAELLGGGESGPTVSLDNPADSLLLEAINYKGI